MAQKIDQLLGRAKANLQEDNHKNALRLFNEVLNHEPGHQQALRSKALIKITSGKKSEAEDFLLFAIEQQPEDDQLYQMLGTFYLNNDALNKALDPLERATEINPSNNIAHQGLGLVYGQFQGDHEKAVSHFTKAIELSEGSANAYFNRGCSYMILKNMPAAESDLRKAAKLGHPRAKEMIKKYF